MPKGTGKTKGGYGPKRVGHGYDIECVYQYIKTCGGSIDRAYNMAVAALDQRVPKARKTWYVAARKNEMRERYQKETLEEWKQFHDEVDSKKQLMMDTIASSIMPVIKGYGKILQDAIDAWTTSTKEGDKNHIRYQEIRSHFPLGPEIFDRMCRLYMRSVGLPEKIMQSSIDIRKTTVLTYEAAENQKKLSRQGAITRPMIAKDITEAKSLMKTIDLGPDWRIDDDD